MLESIFVQYIPPGLFGLFGRNSIVVPHFLIVGILFLTIYGGRNKGILYAFIFGLLFDIVYTEILGIYLFLYPLIAYIVSKIMHVLQVNLFSTSLISLVGIALLELGVYELNFIIHITSLDFSSFLHLRFYPTLLFNAAFLLLACYPLQRIIEKYSGVLRDE
jgi:rod shape-determining protein MreD